LHQASVALWRELGTVADTVRPLNSLGLVALGRGDFAQAREFFDEAMQISREHGDQSGEALALNNLGRVAFYEGDYNSARSLLQDSLLLRRILGERWGIGHALCDLADVALAQGDDPGARALQEESLLTWREVGDSWGTAYALEGVACIIASDQPELAVRFFGTAAAARTVVGIRRLPVREARLERVLAGCRQVLGDSTYAHAWAAGSALSVEQALAAALQVIAGAA
jgi:tetratricopeptide (TPR) repeat protein